MSVAATDARQGQASGQRPSLRRPSDWWVPLGVALSLLIGAVLMASKGWVTVGDVALMELRLQAMPEDMPLVGVYSRYGWWHPGPAFLLWSWLGYTVGGGTGAALLMSIAVLHVAVLVCAWWLARQVNVVAAQALMLAAVVSLLVRPIDLVLTPWNPYVGLAGVLLLVAAGWGLAARRSAAAFVLLPWSSFLVQSHVGYLPVVAAVVLTAFGLMVIDEFFRRRAHAGGAPRVAVPWRALLLGAVVSAVMWLPPVVQQITGDPGNLGLLAAQLGGDSQGLQAGLATMRAAFAVPMTLGPNFVGELPGDPTAMPWLLVLPIAAGLVALVRRRREQIFAMVLLAAVLVAALVSVAGLTPPAFEYLVPWLPSVVWLTLTWSVWVLVDPFLGQRRWWATVVGAAAVTVAVFVGVGLAKAPPPLAPFGTAAEQLWSAVAADAALGAGEPGGEGGAPSGPTTTPLTLIGDPTDEPTQAVAQGMAALAVPAGADVAVDEAVASRVERVVAVDGPGRTRYVVRTYAPGLPTPEGQRVVATYDPFTAAQWVEITRLEGELANPDLDPLTRLVLATELAELQQGQQAFQVLAPA